MLGVHSNTHSFLTLYATQYHTLMKLQAMLVFQWYQWATACD